MSNTSVNLEIMDKKFKVSCTTEEKTTIIDASELVNRKIDEIKKHGKSAGSDRVAIMAALNIANEYLLQKDKLANKDQTQNQQIASLLHKIENSLNELRKF